MDLLKEHPLNFRYYLQTSVENNIYISFKYFVNSITEDQDTDLESCSLLSVRKVGDYIDDNQTVRKTVWENDVTIDNFYTDVYNYIKDRVGKGINKIIFTNFTQEYDHIVFEPRIFKIMSECAKNFKIDINSSAFRITSEDYGELNDLYWTSGSLLIEDSSTINFKTYFLQNIVVDKFNEKDADKYVKLLVREKINIINIKTYSTLKLDIHCSNVSGANFGNCRCLISYANIFGSECSENDKTEPRIRFQGFKSILVDLLEVNDEVTYGSMFKLDNSASFTINQLKRNVSEINQGTTFVVGKVGSVSIYKLDLVISENTNIQNDLSIFSFLKDDSAMKRKIYLYDTEIVNNSEANINICKLRNMELYSIYIANCVIKNGINLIDINNGVTINKFYLNNTDIKLTGDITFKNIKKLSISSTNIEARNIRCEAEMISVNDGKWKFNDLTFDKEDGPINKHSLTNMRFEGKSMNILNSNIISTEDSCKSSYDTGSTFKVDKIVINGFNITFDQSMIQTEDITINGDKVNKFIGNTLIFKNKECRFKLNGTFIADILIDNSDSKDLDLYFDINDNVKFSSNERLSFSTVDKPPTVYIETNMPIVSEVYGFKKEKYLHFKMKENYVSKQKSTFTMIQDVGGDGGDPIMLNDSEKICTLSKTFDPEFQSNSYVFKHK